jgi:Phosphodiester glycosidase/FlgD Ig-like domain
VVRRSLVLAAFAALVLPSGAPAQSQTLMPGVTYSREVQFTPHGPVVINVLTSPRPTGLWGLHPVLANGLVQGRRTVTAIQKTVSTDATVAGTNGDLFNAKDGHPTGIVLQSGVLKSPPFTNRSSLGIDAGGSLRVQRVAFFGTWQGNGQRRPMNGFNQKPGTNGISLYTPAWGPTTPPLQGDYEVVLAPFPQAAPNANLTSTVVGNGHDGGTAIPANGAVLVARGVTAQKLAAEAPQGRAVVVRLGLKPAWSDIVDAIGGGPIIVRGGVPVFRSNEAFQPDQLLLREPRTAVGQTASGKIVQIVTDGGQPGYSVGMTTFELAQTLVRLGVVTGMALDSGDSSTAAFDGTLLSGPSRPAGELPVKECLCVFYYGVYAPPPTVAVLSPNGDGVDETQALAYKVVRPSTVTAKLIGPDRIARITQTAQQPPGVYPLTWNGLTTDGAAEQEGLWRWTVTAADDLGRTSSVTRSFWLNDTLGFLRVPSRVTVRNTGAKAPVVATFQVTHAAQAIVRIETSTGVVLRTLVQQVDGAGPVSVTWDGRTRDGVLVYTGTYVVHVTTVNTYGSANLSKPLAVKRVIVKPPPKKKPRKKKPPG